MGWLIRWLEQHQVPCPNRTLFGIDCPGCGMQTSIIELLKGNLWESIKAYPALFPVMFLMTYLILFLIYKFKNGPFILKISFIFTATIIFANYILKIFLLWKTT
ncbi:MAG: DUF2752 domain-containing protein [Bacteroidota bacterium]